MSQALVKNKPFPFHTNRIEFNRWCQWACRSHIKQEIIMVSCIKSMHYSSFRPGKEPEYLASIRQKLVICLG